MSVRNTHTQFPIQKHIYHEGGGSFVVTFEMFTQSTLYKCAMELRLLGQSARWKWNNIIPCWDKNMLQIPPWTLVDMCLSSYLCRMQTGSHTESMYRVHKNVWGEYELSLCTYRAEWKCGITSCTHGGTSNFLLRNRSSAHERWIVVIPTGRKWRQRVRRAVLLLGAGETKDPVVIGIWCECVK